MRTLLEPAATEPRLERMFAFPRERRAIAAEVVRRVLDDKLAAARDRGALEVALNEVCFHEEQRFRSYKAIDENDSKLRGRLARLRKGLRRLSDGELREAVADLAEFYVDDIVGNFNPAVWSVATRILPVGMSLLFAPVKIGRSLVDLSQLRERFLIEGTVADLERLSRRGTLVLVPTHLSNLDSIAIGFALERARLPPCTYGAGKNLFTNPVLGFFMRNLGAYRVDRRIKHDFYKDVLKTYSTVLLERGYHSLFFPGGTRARSGAIESHLKLGLASTALRASINNLARAGSGPGGARPIYIVPATINYHLVLEAQTLIDDYLKESGKSRYIIDDDESTQVTRIARYLRDTLRSDGSMTIRFSEPLDVLGHRVGPDGLSYDDRGRPVELKPFLTVNGKVKADGARDAEYTRQLGERIVETFKRDTHILSTHLVAYVMHRALVKRATEELGRAPDLFRLLRGIEPEGAIPEAEVLASIERVKSTLAERAERREVRLGLNVAKSDARGILDEALRYFALFHETPTIERDPEGGLVVSDRPLNYYYHNRLVAYGLEGGA